MATVQIGEQGELAIPSDLRRAVGIQDRSFVTVERWGSLLVVRPADQEPEDYTAERKAEFLLSNAIDEVDYAAASAAVRAMGLDPRQIHHLPPMDAR